MASVGTHIRRLRTAKQLTQAQLAEKLFVTRQAVSAWETGKALPDVETLERIAAALVVDVTEVIYGISQSPNLRRLKRRWALIGCGFATILAIILIILPKMAATAHGVTGSPINFGIPTTPSNMKSCPASGPWSWISKSWSATPESSCMRMRAAAASW